MASVPRGVITIDRIFMAMRLQKFIRRSLWIRRIFSFQLEISVNGNVFEW